MMMTPRFVPDAQVADLLHCAFQTRLKNAYVDLLKQIKEYDGSIATDDLFAEVQKTPSAQFNGIKCFAYNKAVSLCEKDDVVSALQSIKRHFCLDESVGYYIGSSNEKCGSLIDDLYASIASGEGVKHQEKMRVSFQRPPYDQYQSALNLLKKGMGVLRESSQSLFEESAALVRNIGFFSTQDSDEFSFLSLTGNLIQSFIFINSAWNSDWVDVLDKYIHESAHAYLFLINLDHELVLNPETERFPSPLRQDLRHMPGIYHSVFVIQRLLLGFSKIKDLDSVTISEKKKIENLIDDCRSKVHRGYETLSMHGRMSHMACRLIYEGMLATKYRGSYQQDFFEKSHVDLTAMKDLHRVAKGVSCTD